MSASLSLEAKIRDKAVRAKMLRRQKWVPAEFYGHGMENLSLSLPYQDFRRIFRQAGENTIIDLKIDGVGDRKVLVHQVDYHPVNQEYQHVEFINVRMDEKVTTHIAIRLEGQAPAVKELAGTLVQSLDEIEITCLPGDLIHEVVLNVEGLTDFNAALRVSDIVLPATITLKTDPQLQVASVMPPRAEEEAPVPTELPEVEVLTEKKKEEGAEGEAAELKSEKKEKKEKD